MSDSDPTNPTPPRARRKQWKPAFVAAIRKGATVGAAARAAGIDRTTAYAARTADPAFRAAWDEGEQDAIDTVEALLVDRIVNGVERPVFYQGKQCGVIREYSDHLMFAFLRAHRPERWALTAFDETKLIELARRVREDQGRAPGSTEDPGSAPGNTAGPPGSHPA
jgi:hypothetical protein